MADSSIPNLTAVTTPAASDLFEVDQAGTSKKMTMDQLVTHLQKANGMPRVKYLTAQHSISSATATKVTDLDITLEAGHYTYQYYLIEQSATVTVAPLFGINFSTGSTTRHNWWFQYADLSGTLLAAIGTVAHDTSSATLGFQMAKAEDDLATTTPNMGPSATTNAVQTINTNMLVMITGFVTVATQGNLELWHGSETATATSVEVGSSLVVIRTG